MNNKIVFLMKFICIVYLVVLVPRFISWYGASASYKQKRQYVLLGIENLVTSPQHKNALKRLQCGLLCHEASRDQTGRRSLDLLVKHGISIKKIFLLSPEQKESPSIFQIKDGVDVATKIPIAFVDGLHKPFSPNYFLNVDAMIVDLQEQGVGSEQMFYFLRSVMLAALQQRKKLIIVDRPNPFATVMEGPGVIPWRHGLTIGELAYYLNKYELESPIDLKVIPIKHWRRSWGFLGLPFLSYDASIVTARHTDSFLSLMSHLQPLYIPQTNKESFKAIFFSAQQELSAWETRYLKRLCWKLGLHCMDHAYYDEKRKQEYHGVKVRLKEDINRFSAFNTFLTLARFLNNRKQITLTFSSDFDHVIGSTEVKKFLQGVITFEMLKKNVEKSLSSFYDKVKHCCLYKPLPIIMYPELVKV